MCGDCGCEKANVSYFSNEKKDTRLIEIEQSVLSKNNAIAHNNSHWFADHHVQAINIMSSPGSGKTKLLEKTLQDHVVNKQISILVGDQQTEHDADRLKNVGANVLQINTHSSCHLDASMIERELGRFVTGDENILFIENIGNLVCPAAFSLGEKIKVAILSVTEGEDKPLKYPVLFHNADLILITKIDLLPYLDFEMEQALKYIRAVNPQVVVLPLSAKTGAGMNEWYDYLTAIAE